MATRTEIVNNIENTKEDIAHIVDEISNVIHKKIDLKEKIKENPYKTLSIAIATGFFLANFSNPIGKTLLRIAIKSSITALGVYISKKSMHYFLDINSGS
ncbi:MAG: hypothetical protein V2B14_03505 [bacterium]